MGCSVKKLAHRCRAFRVLGGARLTLCSQNCLRVLTGNSCMAFMLPYEGLNVEDGSASACGVRENGTSCVLFFFHVTIEVRKRPPARTCDACQRRSFSPVFLPIEHVMSCSSAIESSYALRHRSSASSLSLSSLPLTPIPRSPRTREKGTGPLSAYCNGAAANLGRVGHRTSTPRSSHRRSGRCAHRPSPWRGLLAQTWPTRGGRSAAIRPFVAASRFTVVATGAGIGPGRARASTSARSGRT